MAFDFKDLKILIADDDRSIREISVAVLRQYKCKEIHIANNGEQAFELFSKHKHDVILTDWQMAPVNGLELVRLIRGKNTKSPNRKVPVILATGYTSAQMIQDARDSGINEFLVKPYSMDDLVKRISYVLNKPRDFIDVPTYAGPDRRRVQNPKFTGPYRRQSDKGGLRNE